MRKTMYALYFIILVCIGIVVGCFIHAQRVNQTTLMSGVAFVRELPYGEHVVGIIETTVFSYQEKRDLEQYRQKHEGQIQIDPEVLKRHRELYREPQGK